MIQELGLDKVILETEDAEEYVKRNIDMLISTYNQ